MRLLIAAVGQRQPRWVDEGVADYLGRFPPDFEVRLVQVKPEPRSGQPVPHLLAAEAQRLRAATSGATTTVALDERGRDWTTAQLAEHLRAWRDAAETVAFVIGGPDGLDAQLRQAARMQLRLSSFTLPHAMARILLAEQLYRAWSILAHHPYHRA